MTSDPLAGRCGSCARFVRVFDTVDTRGVPKRAGECLLEIWPPPLYETNTCGKYVLRGTFADHTKARRPAAGRSEGRDGARSASRAGRRSGDVARPQPLSLPEDLLSMDANEFRAVLRSVLHEELGLGAVDMAGRWEGGELVLVPGKEGTAEKRVPLEAFFKKIVSVRDKLRVLEQKLNAHAKLSDEEKVQFQQYVTQCYGSLTTFNILFSDRDDAFKGQSGGKDD